MLANIPNLTTTPTLSLIYRASRDGVYTSDFHRQCDLKGRTVTFVRSSKGFACAGYTKISWSNSTSTYVTDPDARLFALTGKKTVYKPGKPEYAVWHYYNSGPSFSGAMGLWSSPLTSTNGAVCMTNNRDWGEYNVKTDAQGNSLLTGDGAGQPDGSKWFTASEIEVYQVIQ